MQELLNVAMLARQNAVMKYDVCSKDSLVKYAVSLSDDYAMSADALLQACDEHTKVVWVCSPNNPTGRATDERCIGKNIVKVTLTVDFLSLL